MQPYLNATLKATLNATSKDRTRKKKSIAGEEYSWEQIDD